MLTSLLVLLACQSNPDVAAGDTPPVTGAAVAAVQAPRVDPRLSVGRAPFGDIDLWLELGHRTVGDVDRLLAEMWAAHPDPNERLAALVDTFRGTPFEYESQLPTPEPGTLRVQLRSFDCTTFVVTMVAMAQARSFDELVVNLRRLRYLDGLHHVDADPTDGNVLDYPLDVLVHNGVGQGYLRDVTAEVAGDTPLTRFAARVVERRRTVEYDTEERLIRPRLNAGEVVSAEMIARRDFEAMDTSRVRDGDVLLFSRVDPDAPVGDDLLVGHLAIARVREGVLTLSHATRDYVWQPKATWQTKPTATGIFYADDPRREQLGVSDAGVWVDDPAGSSTQIDGHPYYGYDVTRPRPLTDYMEGAHIRGVMILRPTTRTDEARAADAAFLAALPAREGGDAPPVVDSAMDEHAAIREGLSPDCPEDIAAAQRLVPVVYRGYDGVLHQGQIVVHRRVVPEVNGLFAILRETGLPLKSVIPISHPAYGWDDLRSMEADNTSGFNWRTVPDTTVLSRHACGLALDVNPRTNPYVRHRDGALLVQPEGAVYDPGAVGALFAEHPGVRKLVKLGWTWGGNFQNLKDWQHFEKGVCDPR